MPNAQPITDNDDLNRFKLIQCLTSNNQIEIIPASAFREIRESNAAINPKLSQTEKLKNLVNLVKSKIEKQVVSTVLELQETGRKIDRVTGSVRTWYIGPKVIRGKLIKDAIIPYSMPSIQYNTGQDTDFTLNNQQQEAISKELAIFYRTQSFNVKITSNTDDKIVPVGTLTICLSANLEYNLGIDNPVKNQLTINNLQGFDCSNNEFERRTCNYMYHQFKLKIVEVYQQLKEAKNNLDSVTGKVKNNNDIPSSITIYSTDFTEFTFNNVDNNKHIINLLRTIKQDLGYRASLLQSNILSFNKEETRTTLKGSFGIKLSCNNF